MRKNILSTSVVLLCMALLLGCQQHTHDYLREIVTEADCGRSGLAVYTCACGDTYQEELTAAESHAWNEGIVSAEASCAADGMTVYTCAVCKETKEEVIPAVGAHQWGEAIVTRSATCAEEGEARVSCERCAGVETRTLAKLETHTWDAGETTKEATCTEEGVLTYSCAVCHITKTEAIPVFAAHVWDAKTIKEPTCAAPGEIVSVCEICQAVSTEAIPVLDVHTWDAGKTSKEPTCAEQGEVTFTCRACKTTKTEKLPRTKIHVWDSGTVTQPETCSESGSREYACTVCRKTKTDPIPATGLHQWDQGIVTKEATCAAYGNAKLTCTACGASKNQRIAKTDEHSWDSGRIAQNPTCAKEGVYSYSCLLCRTKKSESIPRTEDHRWKKSVSVEPTYTTAGVMLYDCTRCDQAYTEPIKTYNFDPAWYGDAQYIKSSNNPDNYVEFRITGSTLKITGKIIFDDLEQLWLRCGNESETITVSSGQLFSVSLSLKHVKEKTFITVYTRQKNGDGRFWGYIWNEVAVVPEGNGYAFVHSKVLDHNIEVMKHWVDPRDCLSDRISEQLIQLSDTIVGSEKDEYRKLYLLNQWVAENIYYDYDYLYGRSKKSYYSADDVYEHRRSVCAGYATLLKALIQAQGIPCMEVSTFSVGVGTSGVFDENNYLTTGSNHAHVEAYLASEDRWVIMDPTWDSRNKYEYGEFIPGTFSARYFDVRLDFFSYTHKLVRRPD